MNETKYEIDIICENCGFFGKIFINKGSPVSGESCPNCLNKTLTRDPNPHMRVPRTPTSSK